MPAPKPLLKLAFAGLIAGLLLSLCGCASPARPHPDDPWQDAPWNIPAEVQP